MGQLAGRLKEILRGYDLDPRAHQAELDAIDALERSDPARAHERFVDLRDRIALRRFADLHARLRAFPFLSTVPDGDASGLTLREVERGIAAFERAIADARSVAQAVAEVKQLIAGLAERTVDVRFERLERFPFEDLARAAGDAEGLRRGVAREARLQERYRAARGRAARLSPATVAVPDLTSVAVPDPDEASAALDAFESRVAAAEAVNAEHARVAKALRDPAVEEFRPERRRGLREEADRVAASPDRAAAAPRLAAVAAEAEALRREAAALAQRAARARKRGTAPPERERRRGDPQDYYL